MELIVEIFRIAGLVLLFAAAVSIFLNIAGYTMIGGEAKKTADLSICKLAAANCITQQMSGNMDCEDLCAICPPVWLEKCLKGDSSLISG